MQYRTLPLEINLIILEDRTEETPLFVKCTAAPCPWSWPLGSENAETNGLWLRNAVQHVFERCTEWQREPARTLPEPAPASTNTGYLQGDLS